MRDTKLKCWRFFAAIVILMALFSGNSTAATLFYTNQASWISNAGSFETFITNGNNMTTANEISSVPGYKTLLGNKLTFESSNTGLSLDFEISCLQGPDAQFVYNDHPYNYASWQNTLSVGQINEYEVDDWALNIISASELTAVAFDLIGNHWGSDSLDVLDLQGNIIASLADIPAPGDEVSFLGIISDTPIGSIRYNGDNEKDDIAIANFHFTVPEPGTILLLTLGGLYLRKRKK